MTLTLHCRVWDALELHKSCRACARLVEVVPLLAHFRGSREGKGAQALAVPASHLGEPLCRAVGTWEAAVGGQMSSCSVIS